MQKLSAEELLTAYKKINGSYKRKAIFHLTTTRGFGSVFNDMILAMLYCLENRLQFQLASKYWISSQEKIWEKFFIPCCTEQSERYSSFTKFRNIYCPLHILLWRLRYPNAIHLNSILILKLQRHFDKNNYLSKLIGALWFWWQARTVGKFVFGKAISGREPGSNALLPQRLLYPQLGIDGDIFHAKSIIARMFLQPTANMVARHREAIKGFQPYIAIHIRMGDRVVVRNTHIEVPSYLQKIKDIAPDIQNLFVATDDYSMVLKLRELRPDLKITTFCDKGSSGYYQDEFIKNPQRQEEVLGQFLTDIYWLKNADHFVGSSSNVSRLVALLRREKGPSHEILDTFAGEQGWHPW